MRDLLAVGNDGRAGSRVAFADAVARRRAAGLRRRRAA
jgi:hypothetical protein